MVVEKRQSSGAGQHYEENNQQSYAFDTHIDSTTGKHRVYIHILSSGDAPNVRLYLYGLTSNLATISHLHGNSGETRKTLTGAGSTAHSHTLKDATDSTGSLTNATSVPQEVTIWIDGVEKTATIGDPNTKGATMYDGTNDDWGVDGTTEWNTGELDLSSLITWSQGEHYLELRCGGTGGRLLGNILVN